MVTLFDSQRMRKAGELSLPRVRSCCRPSRRNRPKLWSPNCTTSSRCHPSAEW
jgi:ATP-dependent helicase YprA (DUF1998 family)